ncbi:hypothetical protein TBLA_0A07710 [Henningerozyma blattae CBS 6284]|uniref:Major facilitator superfamily (MFS) profile domain-containing protein n=1 Tax=Henningerozyma blattae (strain ATCC 34711 / CBS 6284 / DSM 70876 / NBRC 10599 / NRRL Y-10934 / UCD 77-7) TaxID=1071380 RepID=I2GWQ8_HENB6|nr:hypothetical protein TBLA_0A07710 [Tetrapisispora blattae CBS 6284]CCH58560.1 hypothetical protein TBLA_0A07710 [Tetrapisispora blattae CBS 6284]
MIAPKLENKSDDLLDIKKSQLEISDNKGIYETETELEGEVEVRNEISVVNSKSDNEITSQCTESSNQNLVKPILLCAMVSFGGFLLGWDIGTIGGIVNMPSFQENFGNTLSLETGTNYFTETTKGLIVAIFNLAALVGGITIPRVSSFWGRKIGMHISAVTYFVGILIQIIPNNNWIQFLVGRIIAGIAVGSYTVLVPMYVSESSPVKIRGSMIALYQLIITLAIVLGNLLNYFCKTYITDIHNNNTWRIPISLGLLWVAFVFIGVFFVPESPQFLAKVKYDEIGAKKSLSIMNGVPEDNILIKILLDDMFNESIERPNKTKKRFEFITGEPKLGLRLFIGVFVMGIQQLSGINYFFYYGTSIFNKVGIQNPYLTAIILSSVNFFGTCWSIYFIEFFGRRGCLIIGATGMMLSLTIFSSIASFGMHLKSTGVIMIISTCVYVLFFATTLGPASFVLISELYPIKTRVTSISICSGFNWLMNFLVSFLTPIITKHIGYKFGYIFVGSLVVGIIFDIFMLPETKGRSENEINEYYRKK